MSSIVGYEQCFLCSQRVLVTAATYKKLTAMLIIVKTTTYRGLICEKCNKIIYRTCLKHCLISGWWSITSLFIRNPIAIVGNIIMYDGVSKRFKKFSASKNVITV